MAIGSADLQANWTPVKLKIFSKTKFSTHDRALEAKSEFNLGFGSTHRSFWIMTQLWGFETRKFNSYSLDGSRPRETVDEAGGQPSFGKTSFTIIVTNFVQNWENLRNSLGIFSCEKQTWHEMNIYSKSTSIDTRTGRIWTFYLVKLLKIINQHSFFDWSDIFQVMATFKKMKNYKILVL